MLPYATLFDRKCRVVWVSKLPDGFSRENVLLRYAWDWAPNDAERDKVQHHFARCLVFGETQCFQTVADFQDRQVPFSVCLFPSDLEEVGIVSVANELLPGAELLTDRECELLRLVAQGLEPKQIARQLDIARSTVVTHVGNCKSKLRLKTRESLIAFSTRFFH